MKKPAVALVTGASSGIGRASAIALAKDGLRVYGTCRNPHFISAISGVEMLSMDVTDPASIHAAVSRIISAEGRLDVLVCCAGMGIAGAVEDCDMAEIALQMDTNFLGTVRAVKEVLPYMRAAGSGRIIIVGSIAGLTGMPFQAFYSSSKHALEGLTESLRYELRAFGIQACIVEPGDFRTGFTDARRVSGRTSEPYSVSFGKTMNVQIHDERNGHDPAEAGRLVVKLMKRRKLPVRVSVGPLFQRIAVWGKRLLPAPVFEKIYRMIYKLP